jgi:hypothetical protein
VRPSIVSTLVAVALPAVLLFGCGGTDEPGGAGQPDPTDDGVVDPETDLGDVTDPDVVTEDDGNGDVDDADTATDEGAGNAASGALEPRVEEAIAQLVDDGIERDAIALVLAEPVVWSDGSIGCPEPGMMYTQALVEGYRIVLTIDGEEVAFHGADNQPPFRCDGPVEPASGGTPSS